MNNRATLESMREQANARAGKILAATEGRGLSQEEFELHQSAVREANIATAALSTMTKATEGPVAQRTAVMSALESLKPFCRAIGDRLAGRQITNDITTGSDGSLIVPLPALERIETLIPQPALKKAGATFLGQEITFGSPVLERGVLFSAPGSAPSTYSEGSGPSSSNDVTLFPVRVSASYYSDLQKVSIQFYQDADYVVQAALVAAEIGNTLYSIDAVAGDALLAAIPGVNSTLEYSDLYGGVLGLIESIHSYFLDDSCCFIGGRQAKRSILNQRDTLGRPLVPPFGENDAANGLLGFRWITAEWAANKVIFGSFSRGVTAIQTGVWFQLLKELYAQTNEFGLKTHCRAGYAYYGSTVPSNKPQPLSVLNCDLTSS